MTALDPRRYLFALKGMGIRTYAFEREVARSEPAGEDAGLAWTDVELRVKACTKCELSKTRRTTVFGEGSPKADLVFVGEAPGEEEDLQGRPFVGRAGKFLDQMIERIGLRRDDVFICNVLKCRPPGNRDPEPGEVKACRDYLFTQLELIKPKVICALGRHAVNLLLDTDARITKIRGKLTDFRGTTLLPTYHPSYLLRNPDAIKEVWEDMEALKRLLKSGA